MPTSHRLRFADIEGNGRKVLVNFPLDWCAGGRARLSGSRRAADVSPRRVGSAKRSPTPTRAWCTASTPTAWDGGARDVLLSASFLGVHALRFENGQWARMLIVKQQHAEPRPGSRDDHCFSHCSSATPGPAAARPN